VWVRFKRHPDPCQAFRSTIFTKAVKTFMMPKKEGRKRSR
jgi:hypothetical protein